MNNYTEIKTAYPTNEDVQYKQLENLITIRKCVVFFTVLTVISLSIAFISFLFLLPDWF